jgi:hypothetical protein
MIFDFSKNNIFNDMFATDPNVSLICVHNFTSDIHKIMDSLDNQIIILFYIGDAPIFDVFEEILCKSKNYYTQYGKLKNYFIFLNVQNIHPQLYKDYSDFFSIIIEPNLYCYFNKIFPKKDIPISQKTKYFLSLNGRADYIRQLTYYFFNKFNLLEKSYFSYLGDDDPNSPEKTITKINPMITDNPSWAVKKIDFEQILKTIPFRIHGHSYTNKKDAYLNGEDFLFADSFCSLINETYWIEPLPFFTEKTFRIIANGHPFIIHNSPNSLKYLNDMGFKTFDDFWDESYDKLYGNERAEAIFHLILEISNWSLEKINKISKDLNHITTHNKNHFYNLSTNFNGSIDILENKLNNIIKKKF